MNLNKIAVCIYCDQPEIDVDALIRWNKQQQDWELVEIFDTGFCQTCSENSTYVMKTNEIDK